ncbi:hypothetical protein [Halorubrum sp. CSM-61]|uniref:DUF7568 family protein n=1 Tax=Halorubrum sp. CSM-61 TaxID=2485838 RepID=UPI002AA2A050|nr:hypothetical protein [Halorubrum sp. CSM-61]
MSGDTVASAAVRRRQRRSILKITLTSASKTLHDQFHLIHRHQTRLRSCRCDRLILIDGYPVWSRGYETKDATSFRDELRERPAPDLNCPECPNDDVRVGEKAADGAKVQRWYDCPDCGYEAPSRIVYGAER